MRLTPRRMLAHGPLLAGVVASALLLGVYARSGAAWPLGFVALVPWLLALGSCRSLGAALLGGWLMSVAFVAAVLAWFGAALDAYTGMGGVPALGLLCLFAPLLQPQLLAFAAVRHLAARRHGVLLRTLAGAAAWVACEWLWPKLLGDTLGHGLHAATRLRQVADLGGAAAITLLLLLVNEAVALALTRRREGVRRLLAPLLLAAAVPALMASYGDWRLGQLAATLASPAPVMRVAMVQTSIVDYERRRREQGSYAVVREVLDTHFALSRAAIEHHGADAVLWSETVYPTTFGHPRSADGADLDAEILAFAAEARIALVFGSYDLDPAGEYNAAVFIAPGSGVLGRYRKTHPFPLTEHVPAWLDRPWLRRWLPWAGTWQPGNGARVFPLRAADGRELDVVPLICLDDVRPGLAIDGARLGARAIVGLSNDAWFSAAPLGAELHLAVARFRSIETRLPQLRVTSNGLSAFIDPSGEVLARTAMGDRAVLAGEVPLRDPPPTLMRRWGDWVGGAGTAWLGLLAVATVRRARRTHPTGPGPAQERAGSAAPYRAAVVLLTPARRTLAVLLRLAAGAGLLWIALRMLLFDGLQVNSMLQLQLFLGAVVLPALAAWAIQRLGVAEARVDAGLLVLEQRAQRIEIPTERIVGLHPWRLPLPGTGLDLELRSGRRWGHGLALSDIHALRRALTAAGAPLPPFDVNAARIADYASARAAATWPRLDHPLLKFGLFALLPALPAFRLHQHIAFGGSFGEYYTYGLAAWLSGLLIWWAAWSLGLMLFAALLRAGVELGSVLVLYLHPARAVGTRRALAALGRGLFYLGVPAWLGWRLLLG